MLVTPEMLVSVCGLLLTVLAGAVAWLLNDAKSKARFIYTEEKIGSLKSDYDFRVSTNSNKIQVLEICLARSDQDRTELRKSIEKLDSSKANKEFVDGLRAELSTLRVDIDKRFDKIESLLRDIHNINNNNT